ncbi:recombinase family protein [Nioella aestuarii]|uniref:recombinase family protein n=1 Tax=Nioella aestuarii TaxID=1662864 RepID=UPI003D7FB011
MTGTKLRCAIYTRKSSEEGLEQSFNSLDAQHEACAAYIASQKQEGWILARDRFDDGGQSGGTLDRPALQRLLTEIDAGRIAMVVVYKIDRLTRSLTDFAKLVERLEAAGCSFVSVTQSFNTASSMGRLTLNVLLSFAQFEREVTAERIRDKIAASKRQGLWMGGLAPIGYDPHPDRDKRELVINRSEAETVTGLFELYDEIGCLAGVTRRAHALGLRSKRRAYADGRVTGDKLFSRGQIHHILTNPIYRGLIRHGDKTWPGRHPAIIPEDLWTRVQDKLQKGAHKPRGRRGTAVHAEASLLTGKLRDETGDRLTPTYTTRKGRQHRYYISNRLLSGGPDPTAWRLPGPRLETAVTTALAQHLTQAAKARALTHRPDLRRDQERLDAANALVRKIASKDRDLIRSLLVSGRLTPSGSMELALDPATLAQELDLSADALHPDLATLSTRFDRRRRGQEAKLIVGTPTPAPDARLLHTLSRALTWAEAIRSGTSLGTIAAAEQQQIVFIRNRLKLAFLSPRIQRALRDGTQPPELCLERIIRDQVPLNWDEQERRYGFA